MDLDSSLSDDTLSSFEYSDSLSSEQGRNEKCDYPLKGDNFMDNSVPHVDTLEKLRKLSHQNNLRKTEEDISPKRNSKNLENEKITMKVVAEKMKLPYRPVIKPGMSSPQQTVRNKLLAILKKTPYPFEKLKELALESKPVPKLPVRKPPPGMKEVVEIEVFMPVVDSENNKIIYPESNKPVVKRYYVKKDPISKSRINSETQQESKISVLSVDAKSTEIASETLHHNGTANTESSANDTGCDQIKFSEKCNDVFEQNNKICDTDANKYNETLIEQSSIDKSAISSSKENDVEIVLSEEKLNKKYLETNKESDEQSNHESNKFPSQPSYVPGEKQTKNKNDEDNNESEVTSDDSSWTCDRTDGAEHRQEERKSKLVCTNKGWNRNIIRAGKYPATRSVSLDLSSISEKSKQNGWRKYLPMKSLSSNSIPSGWRKSGANEELSMDSWIERNKYLQLKIHYLQNYRKGQHKWRTD